MEATHLEHVELGVDHVGGVGGVQSPPLRHVRCSRCHPRVQASEESLMTTSGHDRGSSIAGGWCSWEHVTRWIALLKGQKEEPTGSAEDAMADRGHSTPNCRCMGKLIEGPKGDGVVHVPAWRGRTQVKIG